MKKIVDMPKLLLDMEREMISNALKDSGGNVAQAARALTIKRTTLVMKMKRFGFVGQGRCVSAS